MTKWENYLNAYNIMIKMRKGEEGHTLALLLADFPVDELKC